jgi:SNF2 family DNA or RNA helicase
VVRAALSGDRLVLSGAGWPWWRELRAIPGSDYDSQTRTWSFPATRDTVWALRPLEPVWSVDTGCLPFPVDALPQDTAVRTPGGAGAGTETPVPADVPPAVSTSTGLMIAAPAPTSSLAHERPLLPAPVIPGLKTVPWQHQIRAYYFALPLLAGGGCLLAMGMGTGKTLVAVMLIAALEALRVLIIAPLRVVPVWPVQMQLHLDRPAVWAILDDTAGTLKERAQYARDCLAQAAAMRRPLIVAINYEGVYREEFLTFATGMLWDLIIVDEGHKLKSAGGKISLAFKRLRTVTKARLALTGTPLPHSILDAYGLFRFLDPRIFGQSFAAFRQLYAIFGGYQNKEIRGFQNIEHFERQMARITFRVGNEVLDLPEVMHIDHYCDMTTETRQIYHDLEKHLLAEIAAGTITAANAPVKLMRLQQLTGGSIKTDDGHYHRVDTSKAALLEDLLDDIEPEEPVVVFCRFHNDLDIVAEVAAKLGRPAMELSGRGRDDLKLWQNETLISEIGQTPRAAVLAVQIAAGGIGIDLTRARIAIYYSLSNSLAEYDQSLARLHRPGQTRPVLYLHLIMRASVDVRMRRALERRAEVIEAVLNEMRELQQERNYDVPQFT